MVTLFRVVFDVLKFVTLFVAVLFFISMAVFAKSDLDYARFCLVIAVCCSVACLIFKAVAALLELIWTYFDNC